MDKSGHQTKPLYRILFILLSCLLLTTLILVVFLAIWARTFLIERDRLVAELHVVQMILDATYENTNQDTYKEKWFDETIRRDANVDLFLNSMSHPIVELSRIESSPPILGSGVDWIRIQFCDDRIYELVIANYTEKLFGLPKHRPVAFIFDK